jgi:ribosome biogenesis protein BMS1
LFTFHPLIPSQIYDGAKMFELSGIINGKYPKHEVKRLSLHISRVKFRPLVWRNSHPYMAVDRVEDVTPQQRIAEDPDSDRDITLFGYVRGTHMKPSQRVHLIGAGDYTVAAVTALEDPCPLPGQKDRITLKKKDNLLYAPLANVGRVKMDSSGVYIELKNVHYTKKENLLLGDSADSGASSEEHSASSGPSALLRSMQDVGVALDRRLDQAELSLFSGSAGIRSSSAPTGEEEAEVEEDEYDEEDGGDEEDDEDDEESVESGDEEADSDREEDNDGLSDDEVDDEQQAVTTIQRPDGSTTWKSGMKEKATKAYLDRSSSRSRGRGTGASGPELMSYVYGSAWSAAGGVTDELHRREGDDASNDDDDDDDELFTPIRSSKLEKYRDDNNLDSNRQVRRTQGSLGLGPSKTRGKDTSSSSAKPLASMFSRLRLRFVTGGEGAWGAGGTVAGDDEGQGRGEEDGSEYGDFEDLEAEAEADRGGAKSTRDGDDEGEKEEDSDGSDDGDGDDDDDDDDSEAANDEIDRQLRDEQAKRKAGAKAKFDDEYDAEKVVGPCMHHLVDRDDFAVNYGYFIVFKSNPNQNHSFIIALS